MAINTWITRKESPGAPVTTFPSIHHRIRGYSGGRCLLSNRPDFTRNGRRDWQFGRLHLV